MFSRTIFYQGFKDCFDWRSRILHDLFPSTMLGWYQRCRPFPARRNVFQFVLTDVEKGGRLSSAVDCESSHPRKERSLRATAVLAYSVVLFVASHSQDA